jgi:hypothetical protein
MGLADKLAGAAARETHLTTRNNARNVETMKNPNEPLNVTKKHVFGADAGAVAEFGGMTVTDCAGACNVERCVISGKPYCAHPRKGGLHHADMLIPAALARLERAKRNLGINLALEKFTEKKEEAAS